MIETRSCRAVINATVAPTTANKSLKHRKDENLNLNSISKGVFPDNGKVDSVSPVDKQANDKNKVSDFRTVSVLNIIFITYESVIKSQLTSVLNNIFSPYIAAYRESYNTQHLVIILLKEKRKKF